jgi:hypothetical protein
VIDQQTNNTTMQDVNYTAYSFTCKASDYYQYFKLVITAIGNSNQALQLSELSLNYTSDMCAEKGHQWSEGVCTVCGASHTDHSGGTATCIQKAVCEVCGGSYGSYGSHTGGTANCGYAAVCDVVP